MSPPFLVHYPGCFGCGPANGRGMGLQMTWHDGSATAEHTIPHYAEGAPDIAHGGYIAALVDEAMALIGMATADGPTMTAHLEIDYLRPTPADRTVVIRGRAERTAGRRLTAEVEGTGPDGRVCFRGRGVLISVAPERWLQPLADAYTPDMAGPGIVIGLDLVDAYPPRWTIRATSGGITGEPGLDNTPTAIYRGPSALWHDLSRGRRSLTEVTASPDVRIDGDPSALSRLVDCLDFSGERR